MVQSRWRNVLRMTRDEALALIPTSEEEPDEPAFLPKSALPLLSVTDLPTSVQISVSELRAGAHHIDWDGFFFRHNDELRAHCQYIWTRKYWESPLGMPQYLDLVKRGIESRERLRGDIKFLDWDDDGAFIHLSFEIRGLPARLSDANAYVLAQIAKLEEPAQDAAARAGIIASEIAQKISGWGQTPLQELVEIVEKAKTSDEKGRSLEELVARVFGTIPGLTVGGRVRTETEEIDITILNGSDDPRFKREEALVLVECKNWSSKCGKNEFVIFKEKLENRKGRCSLGFLVSWNGFKETVTKEMLRSSHERLLVVPMDGAAVREAVRTDKYLDVIARAWTDAINI